MNPVVTLALFGAVIGGVIGTIIAVIRARSYPANDKRRWGPAILGGIVVYWAVLLSSLGVSAWLHAPTRYSTAVNYTLGGFYIGLATYTACLLSIAVAPRLKWRQTSYRAAIVAFSWVLFFSRNDRNFLGEMLGTVIGAAAAWPTAYRLFGQANAKPQIAN